MKKTFWRILFFYIIGVLVIGMVVDTSSKAAGSGRCEGYGRRCERFAIRGGHPGGADPRFACYHQRLVRLSTSARDKLDDDAQNLGLHDLRGQLGSVHRQPDSLWYVLDSGQIQGGWLIVHPGMAKDGHAPRIFTKCTSRGVPCYAVSLLVHDPS